MIIKKFTYDLEKTWDDFVNKQYFGTIYHTRQFINYHPYDRFIDESILIYDNDELICVLPACKKSDGYYYLLIILFN